jgi:hypothetical protein
MMCDVPSKKQPVYPNEEKILAELGELGERLRLARMRRKF